jgi:hypothetical protein
MSDEIMTMLSNMGALDEDKAVSKKLLNNSERLKNILIDDDIKSLEDRGYVVRVDDRLYLTQSGLVRALSNFS